ncbi:elongation factor 1 gamma, partial [Aureobasidium melanogenum]|uniref:Elongation factor 1 gamma n=1 Tax=Aureobasidium melanogenum (strain CBS 110374) TaxID=1043003 RepID=A0A074VG16_AURM1
MATRNKLYTYKGGPRSIGILAVAHAVGFDIEVVETNPQDGLSEEYLKLNRLGKTPTFVSSDGTVLTECMAIALHVASQDPESRMLGSGHMDFIKVVSWMSLCNSDVVKRMGAWILPLLGVAPYAPEGVEMAEQQTAQAMQIFEDHLQDKRFLVADRLTLADLFCAGLVSFGFAKVFDKAWRARFPCFTAWYEMITALEMYRAVVPHTVIIETALGPPHPSMRSNYTADD